MNRMIKIAVFCCLSAFIFFACKKQISQVSFEGGTPPVLTATTGADTASYLNADKTVLTLNWNNPDYQFSTGVNSQDVTYNIMIDTAGSDFSKAYQISLSKDLSYTFISSQLNDIMLNQLNLQDSMQHSLEFKVISSLANGSVPLTSNSIQYNTTAYAIPPKVNPPASGELYLVGSATAGGWNNPVPTPSQQFTKIDDTHYTLTVPLIGGQQYLFLPVNGDWSHKYACKKTADQPKTGGDFGYDFSDNFPGPDADGTYRIDVDFQKGKYTVTKQ